MIVVTTPTGNIGRQVVENLLLQGECVRIVSRDPAKLTARVREHVEVVVGSHGDAATIDAALVGADALLWLVPPDFRAGSLEALYLDLTRPAVAAIQRLGVRHVVGISNLGRGTRWEKHAGTATASLAKDDLLASSGAAYRALTLPGIMDNMLLGVEGLKQGVFSWSLAADQKHPTVATRDIATVAARLLTERNWEGRADLPLLGPEDLSPNDHAHIMSEVLGKPIRYQQIPYEALEARLRASGASPAMIGGYVAMMQAKDHGLDDAETRTPDVVTPTTFRQWCEEVLRPAVLA